MEREVKTVKVDKSIHTEAKIVGARQGMRVGEFVNKLVREGLKKHKS